MTRSGDVQSQRFHKNSLLIFITDFDGKVLYSTDEHSYKKRREHRDIQNRPQYKPDAEPQSRQKGAERSRPDGHDEFLERLSQSETKRVSYENSTSYIYGAQLEDGSALYISKSLGSVKGTVEILRTQLVLLTIAAFSISFITAYFISRRFSKPIKAISEQAGHIGDENYVSNFEKGFCRETDELSDTLKKTSESLINQFASLSEKNGIAIESKIENNLYSVCDRQSIARVMYNFIDNAISHSGNSQRIFVAVRKTDSKLRFEVHDYGNGIDKESLEHIWDRYFTKKQRKRNQNGSGLGLPISKEILTAHNALYGAESRGNNSTVFWFEIRLA